MTLAVLAGSGVPAWCCSVSSVLQEPYDTSNVFGFYGEVTGHVSMRIPECDRLPEPGRCEPSWGLRLRVLEPLNSAARDLREVEYFEFGTGADCSARPTSQERVRNDYPVGSRVGLAARLLTWERPRPPRIRLTSLRPIAGEAIYTLPKGADLKSLAAAVFDYGRGNGAPGVLNPRQDRSRVDFELWRDTLRLQESNSGREALAVLERMAVVVRTLGMYREDEVYTPIEQLADRYLPDPELRSRFERRLRQIYSAARAPP